MSVRPGHVEIQGAKEQLAPAEMTEEERARRLRIVRQLYGIWSEKDETVFQALREEIGHDGNRTAWNRH